MTRTDDRLRSWLRTWLWDTGAASVLLLLPLLVFLRHNDYPLLRMEVAACVFWVVVAGAFWGGLMTAGRTVGRVLVVTALLVLLVDVQTDWLTTVGLRLLLNVAGFGAVAWLLRRRLSRVVVALGAAMIIATVLQPPGRLVREHAGPAAPRSERPFVLHLVLDEYAAPEALDRAWDTDGEVAAATTGFFAGAGFTVYPRAYSRLFNTDESLPNTLNRGLTDHPNAFWPRGFAKGALLQRNDWFDRLRALDYELVVVQSDFIRYIGPDADGNLPAGVRIRDYTLETVGGLAGTSLAVGDKVRFILGSYYRLSWFLGMFRDGYATLRQGPVGRALHLPDWDRAGNRVSPLTTMAATDGLTDLLREARPGQAVFAHLLLPHFPFAFRADCSLEPMGRMWLNNYTGDRSPQRNTAAERAERYPLYLAQLSCTNAKLAEIFAAVQEAGVWDDALVIVHGDHGSRLNLSEPLPAYADSLSARDYMDAFGTLLAIHYPATPGGGIERSPVALDAVFEAVALDTTAAWPPSPYVPDPAAEPWVLLNDRHGVLTRVPLPPFAHGAPLSPGPWQ